jgi:predicted peptidase
MLVSGNVSIFASQWSSVMHAIAFALLTMELAMSNVADAYEEKTVIYTGGDYQNETFKYRLLKPAKVEEGKKYPVVLFLHGAGERGNDNLAQLKYFPEYMLSDENREKHACYVIAPQCREGKSWARRSDPSSEPSEQMQVAVQALRDTVKDYPVDAKRIYLTGLSMGGYGSWDLAVRHPDWFAAVVPICGGGDESQADKIKNIPIWAWHGDADDAVPVEESRRMIEAIKAAGGSPKYTELKGVGHNSWTPAYTDPQGVVPWMFEQRKESAAKLE